MWDNPGIEYGFVVLPYAEGATYGLDICWYCNCWYIYNQIKVKGQDSKYPKEILPTYMPKMAKTLNPEYVNQRYL
jgi:hypothetical protein